MADENDINTTANQTQPNKSEAPSTSATEGQLQNDESIDKQTPADRIDKSPEAPVRVWKIRQTVVAWWTFIKSSDFTNPAITIATIIIAGATVLTWLEVRGGGVQTDRIIAADERIATAMEGVVGQAKQSLDATIEQNQLDQRAWIVWKAINGTPTLNEPWELDIYLTNTGKTPAKDVKVFCRAQPAKNETQIDFRAAISEAKATLIAPNDTNTFCALNPLAIPKVTQEVLNIFSTKAKFEFIHGLVTYDDIFGKKHWLTFCRRMHPDGKAWDACQTHNDTGDGEPPQ